MLQHLRNNTKLWFYSNQICFVTGINISDRAVHNVIKTSFLDQTHECNSCITENRFVVLNRQCINDSLGDYLGCPWSLFIYEEMPRWKCPAMLLHQWKLFNKFCGNSHISVPVRSCLKWYYCCTFCPSRSTGHIVLWAQMQKMSSSSQDADTLESEFIPRDLFIPCGTIRAHQVTLTARK